MNGLASRLNAVGEDIGREMRDGLVGTFEEEGICS
jgi:hypothetical protein